MHYAKLKYLRLRMNVAYNTSMLNSDHELTEVCVDTEPVIVSPSPDSMLGESGSLLSGDPGFIYPDSIDPPSSPS